VYGDTIVEMHDIFARLHKALEASGQLENTLIIFTSDNVLRQEVWHSDRQQISLR